MTMWQGPCHQENQNSYQYLLSVEVSASVQGQPDSFGSYKNS